MNLALLQANGDFSQFYHLDFVVLAERALENFRQMSARNYDERRTFLIA